LSKLAAARHWIHLAKNEWSALFTVLPPRRRSSRKFFRRSQIRRRNHARQLRDLLTGQVHALVRDRHRSREVIEFLKLLSLTRSVLRHIRVASKQELKDRIMAAIEYFNQQPVVHTWSYNLDEAA